MAGSFTDRIANVVLGLKLRATAAANGARISRWTKDPMKLQNDLLARILATNRDTTFGRGHDFGSVKDLEGFRVRVPVATFEDLRPYVDAEIGGGEPALTRESPVCYVRTSGTTGAPKDLPMVASHLRALTRWQELAIAHQFRSCPAAFAGSLLVVVSPPREGDLSNGRAFGSASGIIARSTPRVVREKFVVPQIVGTVKDAQLKYRLILRLALGRSDLSYVATANATTVLQLIRLFSQHSRELIEDVRRGGFSEMAQLPQDVAQQIAPHLAPNPTRAAVLEALLKKGEPLRIADLWPRLALVGTWTFGSSSVAVEAVRRELPRGARILDIGYMASEFRGTITLGRRSGSGLPTLDTHFFEFVERERWEQGAPQFLTLGDLKKGRDYYVIVTTPSGLYRYFINDLVRVVGRLHRTPLLRFVQKGKGVTSITGEKLYESQALPAVLGVLERNRLTAGFLMILADEDARCYRLYVEGDRLSDSDTEGLASEIDLELARFNLEYESKRTSGRLEPLSMHWLRQGTGESFKAHCVAKGQREGQFKTVALTYKKSLGFDLAGCVDPA